MSSGKPSDAACAERDYGRSIAVVWLWVVPIMGLIAASALVNTNRTSLPVAGGAFVAGTLWIALGCLLNARHCGRLHCRLAAIAYPVLAAVGVAYVAGVVPRPLLLGLVLGGLFHCPCRRVRA